MRIEWSYHGVSKRRLLHLRQALALFGLASIPAVAFTPMRFPGLNPRQHVSSKVIGRQRALLMRDEELRVAEDGIAYPVQEFVDYYGTEWRQYWDAAKPYDGAGPRMEEGQAVSAAFGEPIVGEQEAVSQLLALQAELTMLENRGALATVRRDNFEVVNANYNYTTYYINLLTRPDRRARIEYQLTQHGISAKRFDACRGENVQDSVIDRVWNTALNAKFDLRQQADSWHILSDGERGCAGSHAALWLECVSKNCPMLILEDDALLGPLSADFSRTLTYVINHMAEHDPTLLHFETDPAEWGEYQEHITPNLRIRNVKYAWLTSGYIVWPDTAAELLRRLPMRETVDNFLSRLAYNGDIRMYACDPPIIMQFSFTDGDVPPTGVDRWSEVKPEEEPGNAH